MVTLGTVVCVKVTDANAKLVGELIGACDEPVGIFKPADPAPTPASPQAVEMLSVLTAVLTQYASWALGWFGNSLPAAAQDIVDGLNKDGWILTGPHPSTKRPA